MHVQDVAGRTPWASQARCHVGIWESGMYLVTDVLTDALSDRPRVQMACNACGHASDSTMFFLERALLLLKGCHAVGLDVKTNQRALLRASRAVVPGPAGQARMLICVCFLCCVA